MVYVVSREMTTFADVSVTSGIQIIMAQLSVTTEDLTILVVSLRDQIMKDEIIVKCFTDRGIDCMGEQRILDRENRLMVKLQFALDHENNSSTNQ